MEIGDRLGSLDGFYRLLNHTYRLKEPHALEPGHRYLATEVIDRMARSWFGEDRGLDWFRENGLVRIAKDVEEAYIGPSLQARLPIYLEHFLDRGEELKEVTSKMGLEWEFSDYKPLSEWMPCPSYEAVQKGKYDLIAVHYKFPYVYGGFANENPWINEICEQTNAYDIILNEDVAKAMGFQVVYKVWWSPPCVRLEPGPS